MISRIKVILIHACFYTAFYGCTNENGRPAHMLSTEWEMEFIWSEIL